MREYSLRTDSRSEILNMLYIKRQMLEEQQSLIDEFTEMIEMMEDLKEKSDSISVAADVINEAFNDLQKDADKYISNAIRAEKCRFDMDLFKRSLRVIFLYSEKILSQIEELKTNLYRMSQALNIIDDSLVEKD